MSETKIEECNDTLKKEVVQMEELLTMNQKEIKRIKIINEQEQHKLNSERSINSYVPKSTTNLPDTEKISKQWNQGDNSSVWR